MNRRRWMNGTRCAGPPGDTGPITTAVLEFLEVTRTKAIALRADLYYRLCDELVGKDEWIGELNGCLIFLGTRSEGRTTPLPVAMCRRFR